MPARAASVPPGDPLSAHLTGMLRANEALAKRIKKLEQIVASGATPADTRFETAVDADGNLSVYLRRVSTDELLPVAGRVTAAEAAVTVTTEADVLDVIDGGTP